MGRVCVALAAGLFIVGLWPFSFRPVNHAGWLPDRDGLHFKPDGIAYDLELLPVPAMTSLSDQPAAFSVELWVKPDLEPDDNVFHILTMDDGHRPSNLVLCQWESELLLRTREDGSKRGFREVGGRGMLQMQKERFLTVTADPSGTVFYADGIQMADMPRQMPPACGLGGRLILGNAAEGKHPWTGQLFGLAIFSRALTAAEVAQHHAAWTNNHAGSLTNEAGLTALYLFDERNGSWAEDKSPNRHRIFIPPRYEVLRKIVLSAPWDDFQFGGAELDDVVINILGFVPFGFCVFRFRRMTVKEHPLKSVLFAVAVGAVVSLSIELIQVWLPGRSSSSTDLLCNIVGTLIGALLAGHMFAPVERRTDSGPGSDNSATSPD